MKDDKYIRDNLQAYYDSVEMPGGYTHNLPDTLKTIELYYNGQFKTGKYDSQGLRKFFYNIVKPTCDVATKFIDLDTKDVILKPEGDDDANEHRVWFMGKELKQWLKDNEFGVTLNTFGANLPKYGHIFSKKYKGNLVRPANILNLRFHPASSSLETDEWFYEIHNMTRKEIDEMPWDKDAIEELYSRYPDRGVFDIYECYDYCDEGGGYDLTIRAGLLDYLNNGGFAQSVESQINNQNNYFPSVILYEGKVDELPYREKKWDDVPGRRLGMGFVEYLFDNQVATNDQEYIKRKALVFSGLVAFQTPDETIGRNILTSIENGDIIKSKEGVNRLDTRLQDLQHFSLAEARWDSNTERKTFTFDAARGENQPSGTPLGIANLNAAQVASYFDRKREDFGFFVKQIILEDVLPNFHKAKKKEHILTFSGSDADIERLDKVIVDGLVNKSAFDFAVKTGFFPSADEREKQKQEVLKSIQSKKNRYLEVPEDYYTTAKYYLDVLVTGEQINSNTSNILQIALGVLGSNPAVLQNKGTRSIFFELLNLGGLSPVKLGLLEQEVREAAQQIPPQGQMMAPGTPVAQPTPGAINPSQGAV